MLKDADVQRYTMVPVPVPEGFEREWLARYEEGRADGTREGFAIVDDDGTFLGSRLRSLSITRAASSSSDTRSRRRRAAEGPRRGRCAS